MAGILALSTYLPLAESVADELGPEAATTPVFMAHGEWDPIINPGLGTASCRELERIGVDVEWHAYPMQHNVCVEEIRDIAKWLERAFQQPTR